MTKNETINANNNSHEETSDAATVVVVADKRKEKKLLLQEQKEQLRLIIKKFEQLNKWKSISQVRYVYKYNYTRASNCGFPSIIEVGRSHPFNLTDYQTTSLFGWTTGDYRFVNPIARTYNAINNHDNDDTTSSSGHHEDDVVVEFDEYPYLEKGNYEKIKCILTRDDVLPYVMILQSALLKLPPMISSQQQEKSSKMILWRGHARFIENKIGSQIILKGFTSVSRDRDEALGFAEKIKQDNEDEQQRQQRERRTLLAFVEYYSPRCLGKFSARKDELEVLFPLDTKFQVIGAPENDQHHQNETAVQNATKRLQNTIPNGAIQLIYVKEI